MAKYRKKPVVIEATQWLGWEKGPSNLGVQRHRVTPEYVTGWIDSLEGCMTVTPGDWIITGLAGEKYPCKPDIFAQTYERITQ